MQYLSLSPEIYDLTLWKIAIGIAVTVPCALLGCYLVLRRMSMLGDAISHGVLPGIVFAVLVTGQLTGWPIIVGAMAFGLLTAVLTQVVHSVADVPEDTSMGVVFTGLFALGVVLISQMPHTDLDPDCVLFGLFELIPAKVFSFYGWQIPKAFPTMLGMLLVTIIFVAVLWKELKIVSFDAELASAMGLKATLIHYLLMAMVAGVTVTAFEAVGSVLVIAMLIVPAATAHLLTDRLGWMMALATVVAIVSVVIGVFVGGPGLMDVNSSGVIAVALGALFTLTVFFAPRHGLAVRMVRNLNLGVRIIAEDILAGLYRQEEAVKSNDESAVGRLQAEIQSATVGLVGTVAIFQLRHRRELERRQTGDMALTAAGRRRAEKLVRAHRLWEAYLDQHFDLPPDHLHDPAMRMEHFIGPELREKLASELHQPDTDPHGKAIPKFKEE